MTDLPARDTARCPQPLEALPLLGGFDSGYARAATVLYFTLVHSSLILFGVIGLGRALAGQTVRYPLIGRWFEPRQGAA